MAIQPFHHVGQDLGGYTSTWGTCYKGGYDFVTNMTGWTTREHVACCHVLDEGVIVST